jgi:hypothetical protein
VWHHLGRSGSLLGVRATLSMVRREVSGPYVRL